MPSIKRIDHLAIVVEDLDAASTFYRDQLGLHIEKVQHVEQEAVTVAFLDVGGSHIELLQPSTPDSGVAKYLAKRGGGMHHLCFEVDDIDAMLEKLYAGGVRLINPEAIEGDGGRRYAFIHPESTFGVLIELYQYPG